MKTYISLLRGINVSGQRLIKMDQLRQMYESLGFGDVRSYIQSGNVIFTDSAASENELIERIETAIQEKFGYQVSVILRTTEELEAAIAANPFTKEAERGPKWVHIVFLAAEPDEDKVKEIGKAAVDGEQITAKGRELYLSLPNGAARTKLTNALIERKLKMPSTARNFRTVTILTDMAKHTREE